MRRNILPQKEICGIEPKSTPNFNLTTKHEGDERDLTVHVAMDQPLISRESLFQTRSMILLTNPG